MQVLEARDRVTANEEPCGIAGEPKRLAQRLLEQPSADARLLGVGTRCPDPAPRLRVPVVIDDQRTLAAATVRVREDVLVHPALVGEEIVQTKVVGLREELAAMQQRRDLALVPCDQLGIGHLIVSKRDGTPCRTAR